MSENTKDDASAVPASAARTLETPAQDLAGTKNPGRGAAEDVAESEAGLPAGTVIGERYRVTELIGRGGMGKVYRAEHVLMRKQVAIKVLHREMTAMPEVVQRFEREAVAGGRIEHVNVAKATDFGVLTDGAFYLVLEYVEGASLSDVLGAGALSVARTLSVAHQVADALCAAHEAGVVHRDLKPDNVMLVPRGEDQDLVKVLDFGIAKLTVGDLSKSGITQAGSVFGTPEYMAPEQAAGQAVDHRADIYALGILMYRMLTGTTPFNAEEVSAVLMMQITCPVPPIAPHVPVAVQDLVGRLLEKDPDARPQSVLEVAAWLARLELLLKAGTLAQGATLHSVGLPGTAGHLGASTLETQEVLSPAPSARTSSRKKLLAAALGVAVLAGGLGLGLKLVDSGPSAPVERRAAPPTPPSVALPELSTESVLVTDPELQRLVTDAFSGDADAIEKLERRSTKDRGVQEWLALARGHSKRNNSAAALAAYEHVIAADHTAVADPKFWHLMWEAAQLPELAERVLRLAAARGGARGADLLYAVWVDTTKEETPATRLAKDLVYTPEVREQASPALKFALDMREAETCERYTQLLGRAALHGDARSVRLLKRVQFSTACEIPEEALKGAVLAAQERPGPVF